ncbi:MAG: NAD(P)H-dependent flavin oxidoreductase, partial [Desulfovibrionaceae bacterium]
MEEVFSAAGKPGGLGGSAAPALHIGDLVAKAPIVQGGMGVGVSLSGLAAAVANAGGIGVIATAGIGWEEPDLESNFKEAASRALRRHIRKARAATDGIIGVNIMVALTNYDDLASAAVEEGVDIIFSGAGLPLSLPQFVHGAASPKLAPIVSSGRAADILCRKWTARYQRLPDALVVEGPLAGGHLGFKPEQIDEDEFCLERILVETVAAVAPFEKASGRSIPVIAAGGVYTGADMLRMMRLGAAACQLGTRFV